jgi:hypothetical protein
LLDLLQIRCRDENQSKDKRSKRQIVIEESCDFDEEPVQPMAKSPNHKPKKKTKRGSNAKVATSDSAFFAIETEHSDDEHVRSNLAAREVFLGRTVSTSRPSRSKAKMGKQATFRIDEKGSSKSDLAPCAVTRLSTEGYSKQHRGKLFMLSTKQKNLNRLKAMKGRNLRKTQKKIEARIREKRAVIRKQQQQHVELISKMKALNVGHENTTGDITSSLGRMSLKT